MITDIKIATHLTALRLFGWFLLIVLGSVVAAGAFLGAAILVAILHENTPVWSHWATLGACLTAFVYWCCWELAREQEQVAEIEAKRKAFLEGAFDDPH
jgi:type VI protein secretion system component VasK